jgi:hypothetical protein
MEPDAVEPLDVYLRLDEHITSLLRDHRPPRPPPLTPDQAQAFVMAALFRAAAPGVGEPDPVFRTLLAGTVRRLRQSPLRRWWRYLSFVSWAVRQWTTRRGGRRR